VRLRAFVLVVLALVLALFTSSQTFATTTVPTTAKALPAVAISATPAGRVPVAFGKAQISVPAAWWVLYNSPPCRTGSPSGEVFVDPPPGVFHCPAETAPGPNTTVSFEPPRSPLSAVLGYPEVINGISVFPYPAGPRRSYVVPSLGVEITVDGPLGQRVLHTLTWSPRSVVLANGPAPKVPLSWRSLMFAGLRFSVPADWPVQHTTTWNLWGPVQITLSEAVTLDTDKTFQALPCPAPMPFPVIPSNGVRVDADAQGPTGSFSPGGTCLHIGGLTACPSRTPDYSILFLRVTVPGRTKPVYVSIGLAGSGMVARTILYSPREAP
jgi:hypothetical protein